MHCCMLLVAVVAHKIVNTPAHWHRYDNYSAFYDKTCRAMTPGPTTTDNPKSISAFRDKGGKLVSSSIDAGISASSGGYLI